MTASPADRTRRFLERIAPGATPHFGETSVEITADTWTDTSEITAALLTSLLLRLDEFAPTIHLCVPRGRSREIPRLGPGPLIEELGHEHSGFSSLSRLTPEPARNPGMRLVLGGTNHKGVSVDVDGWRAGLGASASTCNGTPIAAAFAGVLAANEILQSLVSPYVRVRPYRGLVSLWDLQDDGEDGPEPRTIDLGGVAFAACGGVASATGWALALHALSGSPRLVDPDAIDDDGTNLNRHLTASFSNIGDAKAALLGQLLDVAGTESEVSISRWAPHHAADIDTVIASPDHDMVRREVQLDLPRVLLAAGTGNTGTYRVARHAFVHDACGCCLWRGDLTDAAPIDGVARALGVHRSLLEPHVHSPEPLPSSVLHRLNEAHRAGLAEIPGSELIEHICATVRLSPAAPAVSAPTLAAAPGVLLAAELIKERLEAPTQLRSNANVLTSSVLAGPHEKWTTTRRKLPGCECTDETYISHYTSKWSSD